MSGRGGFHSNPVFYFLSPSPLCHIIGKCKEHQVQNVEHFSQSQCNLVIEAILHRFFCDVNVRLGTYPCFGSFGNL